jgi:predicted nucleic acid-binding protein
MTAVFADTFYWFALADVSDSSHQRALTITAEQATSEVITTDEVLGEYLTFFASGSDTLRHRAATSVKHIIANPVIRVIPQRRFSFLSGLDLYSQRPDKGYGLIDCISMQTMRREGLTEALTNDRQIEQEGFRALFRRED